MLVHKGGQINNVQLITGVRIAEMSQLQNCSVICVQRMEVIVKMKKREKKSGGRGQGGCVQRMEVIVKREKKACGGGGGVRVEKKIWVGKSGPGGGGGVVGSGGGGGGVRGDVNREVKLL